MPFTPIKIKVPTPKRNAVGSTPITDAKKPQDIVVFSIFTPIY